MLRELPALLAIGAPSAASYLRLEPSHWAGVFQCWGLENREAAIRFITGPPDDPARRTPRSSASTRRPTRIWPWARSPPPGWPGSTTG
ncbi:hypothetical protein NKH77_03380 [Streptomyces sp. M19]